MEQGLKNGPVKATTPYTRVFDEMGNRITTVWEREQRWLMDHGYEMGEDFLFKQGKPK